MEFFDNRLMDRTFGCFRGQANGEDIWIFSRTGYWGGHLEVFEDRLMGGHLEIFENRLLGSTYGDFREHVKGRTFGVLRVQSTGKYI